MSRPQVEFFGNDISVSVIYHDGYCEVAVMQKGKIIRPESIGLEESIVNLFEEGDRPIAEVIYSDLEVIRSKVLSLHGVANQ